MYKQLLPENQRIRDALLKVNCLKRHLAHWHGLICFIYKITEPESMHQPRKCLTLAYETNALLGNMIGR